MEVDEAIEIAQKIVIPSTDEVGGNGIAAVLGSTDDRLWNVSPMAAKPPSADVAGGGDCGAHRGAVVAMKIVVDAGDRRSCFSGHGRDGVCP